MPQWDRYWPLGLVGSVVLLAASVTLSIWYLTSLFALPEQLGLPPLTDLDALGGTVIWGGGFGGVELLSASLGARRRVRLRRVALLGGDLSMLPLATIAADPAHAPDATQLPLMLPWRRQPRGREWASVAIIALLFGTGPLILVALAVLLGIDWRQIAGEDLARHGLGDFLGLVLAFALATGFAVLGLVGVVVALTSRLGPEYGVVADDGGISKLHLKGQGPRLQWGDARLLEVGLVAGSPEARIFTLYSPHASVSWQAFKKPPRKRMRPAIGQEEFKRRQEALLGLITAHTGLQPRTLSVPLRRDDAWDARPPRQMRRYRLLAYGLGYGVAGALLLLAVAVLALPLTHQPLLDGYAALTTALAGIVLLVIARQALKSAQTASLPQGGGYTLPAAPPLVDETVEVTHRRRLTGRLQDVAFGLVLLLDVVPAFAGQANLPASPPLAFATRAVAGMLFLVAFIGLFAIVNGLSGSRTTLTANADGLRTLQGRETTQLAWDTIVRLSLELEKGTPDSFTALGHDGETITWPARGIIWRPGSASQLPLSPEELAAIVVRRSGVQLTVREA